MTNNRHPAEPQPCFDFLPVDDHQALLQQSYRLRYQVYCNERRFLNADDYPDAVESDQFDPNAHHIAAVNRVDEVIGAVRLVRPSRDQGLPLESHCTISADFPAQVGANSVREALHNPSNAEISRLVVSKGYSRRAADGYYAMSDAAPRRDPNDRRCAGGPAIAMGLYRELYRFSRRNGITHWLAAMERALRLYLKRHHIVFEAIGPEVDYYGPVTPFMVAVDDIQRRMQHRDPSLCADWNRDLEPQPG